MAVACAASVADGYYIQPLLVEIGASLAVPERLLGLLPALTQAGVAAGVLFLLPLADLVSARRLLLAVIPAQMGVLLSLRRLVQPAATGARDGRRGIAACCCPWSAFSALSRPCGPRRRARL